MVFGWHTPLAHPVSCLLQALGLLINLSFSHKILHRSPVSLVNVKSELVDSLHPLYHPLRRKSVLRQFLVCFS